LSLYLLGGTEENEDKTSVRTALGWDEQGM
jgi:hypothetical protein